MPPQGMPPGMAPQPPQQAPQQQGSSPLSALASKGGSGDTGSLLSMILTFLAGMGGGAFMDKLPKMLSGMGGGRGAKGGQSAAQPHTGGPQVTANGPPGGASVSQGAASQMNPQQLQMLLAMLAQKGQGAPPQ